VTGVSEAPPDLDVIADLTAEGDDGLGWSTLPDARAPERVLHGVMLLAGNESAKAVVRVVAVDEDGQIHFSILPGSVCSSGPSPSSPSASVPRASTGAWRSSPASAVRSWAACCSASSPVMASPPGRVV